MPPYTVYIDKAKRRHRTDLSLREWRKDRFGFPRAEHSSKGRPGRLEEFSYLKLDESLSRLARVAASIARCAPDPRATGGSRKGSVPRPA